MITTIIGHYNSPVWRSFIVTSSQHCDMDYVCVMKMAVKAIDDSVRLD